MLVTCEQMSTAERRLFSGGVSAEPFMDQAGHLCAGAILSFFPAPAVAEVFCGKGNNGGDALVVARHLKERGWKVHLHFSNGREGLSELARKKLEEYEADGDPNNAPPDARIIVIDGLLGLGARGDLGGEMREMANQINELRRSYFATCFAIDLPSGLNADTGHPGEGAVVADFTLSITMPKIGFAEDTAVNHVGRLVEIPLEIPVEAGDRSKQFLFPSNLRSRLRKRDFETHKGTAGRVAIVAGSRGFSGAAVLSALGASRSGAGLVTVWVPESVYSIVASQCPPEVMVKPLLDPSLLPQEAADVFAIGPGLGNEIGRGILDLISYEERPVVVDADALNGLARDPARLATLPGNRLFTPHPGELARLTDTGGRENRCDLARRLADEWGVTLLLKGARSVIASPNRPLELNTTGHPGMASGGMGDVLTGVCASLIVQGMDPHDAACVGSWLLGRSAELSMLRRGVAGESVGAAEVAENLGAAIRELQTPGSP